MIIKRCNSFVLFLALNFISTVASGGFLKTETIEELTKGEMNNISFLNGTSGSLVLNPSLDGLGSEYLNFSSLPLPISKCSSIEVSGRLYVVGGVSSDNNPMKQIYSVNLNDLGIDANTWRSETDIPQGLVNPSLLFSNGQMIVVPSVNGQDIFSVSLNKNDGTLGSWITIGKLPIGIQQNSSRCV